MKRVVLISSGQPSVNPRLVKEANSLSNAGFTVYVIYSFWTHWAWEMDMKLFSTVSWIPILAGGSPFKNLSLYFFTKIRFKLINIFAQKLTIKNGIAEIAKGRASVEMCKKAKSIKASIYIAHNLAALPVAVKAAKYNSSKCGFDAEDFHRNEVSDSTNDFNYSISKFIEDKYLAQCDYITAASSLIAQSYKRLYPELNFSVINNVFESRHKQQIKINERTSLKLFWVSQTIGKGRGLEDVINALNLLNNNAIELHLLGYSDSATELYFRELSTFNKANLYFHKPIRPEDIFSFSNQFDIGLALELKTPLNRDICLTNKIFSYLTSGLAIIASDTSAQKAFLEENEGLGFEYTIGDTIGLSQKIDYYFQNRNFLNACKKKSLELASEKYNWEKESEIFLKNLQSLI